jgi:hypothetical protein
MYEFELLKMGAIKECTEVNAIKTATNVLKNDYTINIEDQYKITDSIKFKLIILCNNKNKLKRR